MYRLIKECVEVEQGLYADLLIDGESVELAIAPNGVQPVYLIPIDELSSCSSEKYERKKMCMASYKVFELYDDYCKWFNQNVN